MHSNIFIVQISIYPAFNVCHRRRNGVFGFYSCYLRSNCIFFQFTKAPSNKTKSLQQYSKQSSYKFGGFVFLIRVQWEIGFYLAIYHQLKKISFRFISIFFLLPFSPHLFNDPKYGNIACKENKSQPTNCIWRNCKQFLRFINPTDK